MNENTPQKQIMFSMITGDIYEIESDELKNMDKYQIPLKMRPSGSCRKCYGRMYSDYNLKLKIYTPCSKCVNRCVDFKQYQEDVEIESIKHD
ncbi:MAG: hypothetical protein PHS54_00205 [Clostridia bacterium]|nr:hypothetical protein [Clostridia bacterium]